MRKSSAIPPVDQRAAVTREGYEAGYSGVSAIKCEYTTPWLRDAWLDGHTRGRSMRAGDYIDGRYPDAAPSGNGFGVTTAFRRGSAGGSKA